MVVDSMVSSEVASPLSDFGCGGLFAFIFPGSKQGLELLEAQGKAKQGTLDQLFLLMVLFRERNSIIRIWVNRVSIHEKDFSSNFKQLFF